MEFQKERVFTALNADELKIGSKVICANTLDFLRRKVNKDEDITEVKEIRAECDERRFRTEYSGLWPLAYLVSEPELNWIVYLHRGPSNPEDYYLTSCRNDVWEYVQEQNHAKTKLFEGTEDECEKWYEARKHLADVIAAWEDGKDIQFFEDIVNNWFPTEEPRWSTNTQYRIKPEGLKWTDLKIGDIIQNESYTISQMIIGIDYREEVKSHILISDTWLDNDDLEYWKKVE